MAGNGGFRRGMALLALQALQQRRLLAADVGAGAVVDEEVEVPAVDVVLADQLGLVGLGDRRLQVLALADELAAHVDVAGVRAHGEGGEQRALDQQVRIVPHDLAVLAGAGLGLVRIDHEVGGPRIALGHERPLEAGREARAAAPAQARDLDLVDDPVVALVDQRLGVVPGAARAGAGQLPVLEAVEVLEDAVLVLRARSPRSSLSGLGEFLERGRPARGARRLPADLRAGLGRLPLAKPSSTFSNSSGVRSS